VQGLSSKDSNHSVDQEIPRLLWNLKFRYIFYCVPIQLKPPDTLTFYSFQIQIIKYSRSNKFDAKIEEPWPWKWLTVEKGHAERHQGHVREPALHYGRTESYCWMYYRYSDALTSAACSWLTAGSRSSSVLYARHLPCNNDESEHTARRRPNNQENHEPFFTLQPNSSYSSDLQHQKKRKTNER